MIVRDLSRAEERQREYAMKSAPITVRCPVCRNMFTKPRSEYFAKRLAKGDRPVCCSMKCTVIDKYRSTSKSQ